MPLTIVEEELDLFTFDEVQGAGGAIVNATNCIGMMGGGIARQFRLRYPLYNHFYEQACANGLVRLGQVLIYDRGRPVELGQDMGYIPIDGPQFIIDFPTMEEPGDVCEDRYLTQALEDMRNKACAAGIRSVGIPALGCGVGGMEFDQLVDLVRASLEKEEGQWTEINWFLFAPQGPPRSSVMSHIGDLLHRGGRAEAMPVDLKPPPSDEAWQD